MQDPFYHKEKRRQTQRMLDADACLDSAIYEFFRSLGRGYRHIEDFFANFRVRGLRRFFVEILSDGASFLAIGGYERALALLTQARFPFASLITHVYPLAEVERAFTAVQERTEGLIKAVLVPPAA